MILRRRREHSSSCSVQSRLAGPLCTRYIFAVPIPLLLSDSQAFTPMEPTFLAGFQLGCLPHLLG